MSKNNPTEEEIDSEISELVVKPIGGYAAKGYVKGSILLNSGIYKTEEEALVAFKDLVALHIMERK
jgi:hypothetical protein